MDIARLEQMGKLAEQIKTAKRRVEKAESDIALLKECKAQRKADCRVDWSWKPEIILKKGNNYTKDVTLQVEIPYSVVMQQLVYALGEARRELVRLQGMAMQGTKQ